MNPKAGDVFSWERTFTEEEVLAFAGLSGDRGRHHMQRDARGRLMVHGLLTASVPTKIGGDLNYIAREMSMEFLHPVYAGDTVRCEVKITEVTPGEGYTGVAMEAVCRNQDGREVLVGRSRGIIRELIW
ncbi:Acyl dehydratase [Desulfofundulus australicus DSM 11792]|uniref:Acyl dehydratase n=1 Tax=Desulfofundulus australicus DSM 11792 TaxID=1121425 RepID=A0A1M4S843_9FIRM|nr:MaoC family dehydratase [Desulfofundulus australicus]SHE28384.1 Acyl dehydratase [Desulfofundulus australicus DSM 11792]